MLSNKAAASGRSGGGIRIGRRRRRLRPAAAAGGFSGGGIGRLRLRPAIPIVSGDCGKRRRSAAAVPLPLSIWLQLKQQIQLSSSSSCSCSLPSRKNRENMGRRKHIHKWMKREERINEKYGHTRKYVPLDGAEVKYKIKESRKLFGEADKEGTTQETLYSKFTPQFSSSVSAKLGPQFTSSFSVGAMEDPYSRIAALKYLNAHGCSIPDLYEYASVLDEKRALDIFWAKQTYEDRIAFLEVIYKKNDASGLVGTPLCQDDTAPGEQ